MSPAKSRKAASARKPAGKARAGKAARPKPKAAKGAKKKAAPARRSKGAKPAGRPPGAQAHAHCAATDPFGDACQNLPRRPSRYCVIHSYLER